MDRKLFCLMISIFGLFKLTSTLSDEVESFSKVVIGKGPGAEKVRAFYTGPRNGYFYYAFCDFSESTVLCEVTKDKPLTNLASLSETCRIKGKKKTHGSGRLLEAWGDDRIIVINEIIDNEVIVQVVEMSNCQEFEIKLSSVVAIQVYALNNAVLDIFYTSKDKQSDCYDWICRNIYEQSGKMVVEKEKIAIKPEVKMKWAVLMSDEEMTFIREYIDKSYSYVYKVSSANPEIKKSLVQKMKLLFSNAYHELGMCYYTPYDYDPALTITCVRLDRDGYELAKIIITYNDFFEERKDQKLGSHEILYNLKSGIFAKLIIRFESVETEDGAHVELVKYITQTFTKDGQKSKVIEFAELNKIRCSRTPGYTNATEVTVVEKDNNFCMQFICRKESIEKPRFEKINLIMKCLPKKFIIFNSGNNADISSTLFFTSVLILVLNVIYK